MTLSRSLCQRGPSVPSYSNSVLRTVHISFCHSHHCSRKCSFIRAHGPENGLSRINSTMPSCDGEATDLHILDLHVLSQSLEHLYDVAASVHESSYSQLGKGGVRIPTCVFLPGKLLSTTSQLSGKGMTKPSPWPPCYTMLGMDWARDRTLCGLHPAATPAW